MFKRILQQLKDHTREMAIGDLYNMALSAETEEDRKFWQDQIAKEEARRSDQQVAKMIMSGEK